VLINAQDADIYLNFAYIRRLGTFLPLSDIKTNPVSLDERFKTIALDFREVDEHIWPIVLLDKTKPLCVVEPLHGTFCHFLLHVSPWEFFCCANADRPKKKKHIAQVGLFVLLNADTMSN
jgi:hypothetical protein